MKIKILGNVKHNGNLLSRGDVVDMEETTASRLVESGAAENSEEKVSKKLSVPDTGKGFKVHLKTKETEKKASKKGKK
jgi:hypothetical protein